MATINPLMLLLVDEEKLTVVIYFNDFVLSVVNLEFMQCRY